MNRFIIYNDLPYLFVKGDVYAVRWDEKGFTVGKKVKLKIPDGVITHSELSIKAKCNILDSIGKAAKKNDPDA
jgi:hypothetical protein